MSFVRKELKRAFLCISVGVLALSYPLFVSAFNYTGSMTKGGDTYTDYFVVEVIDVYVGVFYNASCYGVEHITNDIHQFKPSCSTGDPQYLWYGTNCNSSMESCAYSSRFVVPNAYINGVFTDSGGGNWVLSEGFYTDWATSQDIYSSGGDHLLIIGDTIPSCEIGSCSLCEIWTTCQDAGCNWECAPAWSGLGCYCYEPVSQPEECGGFYKCTFCETQETCEAVSPIDCEWVNRGQGFACYTIRPVFPEAQEEWQSCEFDDCDPDPPLGTIEKWVCLLKNNLQGIYCPSQETLTDLQHTIETFEQKFPFNYIVAIKEFLNDIKTSLATPKPITISMFGATGTMNFDFLDMPVVIGGVEETMGNIFTDITSIFIYIAFFFWLLAFIRRFF